MLYSSVIGHPLLSWNRGNALVVAFRLSQCSGGYPITLGMSKPCYTVPLNLTSVDLGGNQNFF